MLNLWAAMTRASSPHVHPAELRRGPGGSRDKLRLVASCHVELCPECIGGGYVLEDDGPELDICPRCDGLGIRQ